MNSCNCSDGRGWRITLLVVLVLSNLLDVIREASLHHGWWAAFFTITTVLLSVCIAVEILVTE